MKQYPSKTLYFSLFLCSLVLLGCLGLIGCTDQDRDSNGPAVAELISLRVKPEKESVNMPGTVQLEAEAVYSDGSAGSVPDDLDIEWNSDNPAVATVDDTGLVTGVKLGHANIAVQSVDGKYPCTRTCKVSVKMEEGDIVTMGKWYDKNGSLTEDITWKIMKVEEATEDTPKRALLVAEKALDCQRYHFEWVAITWEKCSLRYWLTGSDAQGTGSTFYNTAFTDEEKAKILLTEHDTCNCGGTGTFGATTKDLVFVLDEAEVYALYPDRDDRRCQCTEYAAKQGAALRDGYYCWWWLRSPGGEAHNAGTVYYVGTIGTDSVNICNDTVRPAMYIAL